jgi:pimeloyl-ACP methyl ester carboxylesterase/predicted kinase
VGTLLLLAGPKGVGKSWVAAIAERDFGVHYVDADLLILDLLDHGAQPDPEGGWLEPVRAVVFDALTTYPAVSAEITGAWDSDYELADEAEQRGHRVVRLLISAPLDETLQRLRTRTATKVPVSDDEAQVIFARVQDRVPGERWDATLDASGDEQPENVKRVLRELLDASPPLGSPRIGHDEPVADVAWGLRESGPPDAECTVLLLPGGMCSAGSYAEVMAEPALAGTRLVAATLPGQAGAPPPDDYSVESYARLVTKLATKVGADVLVGFSMGASVAVEMVTSRNFTGPVVLLGVSLSSKDEPAFFRGIVHLTRVLGSLPCRVLATGAASMVKRTALSPERKRELQEDFHKTVPQDEMRGLREYVRWLHRHERRAERLCRAGVPTWIVHADKGDGGLTEDERRTLDACPHTSVVTIPGAVFFLPNEASERVAGVIVEAMGSVSSAG